MCSSDLLPAGLALTTDYWVIYIDDDIFSLASSLVNAQAGTAVDITAAAGGGNHTVTATALDATIDIRASIDGTTYVIVASSSNNVTATGDFLWNIVDPAYRYFKITTTITAGQIVELTKLVTWS